MTANSLRDIQRNELLAMLRILPSNGTVGPVWKILILDSHTQKILSPIIRVSELREHDVTLFLQLEASRMPVPDAPAIYFIQPTRQNVEWIIHDLEKDLYASTYLCFSSYLSGELMEMLAGHAARLGVSPNMGRITDQYADYICLEPMLWVVDEPVQSYQLLTDPQTPESAMEAFLSRSLYSLLCVVSSLGFRPPLIRCVRHSPSEALAMRLETMLRDHLATTHTPTTSHGNESQDLVLLVDREVDLSTPLTHGWTYGSLTYDLLTVRLNRVTVAASMDKENESHSKNPTSYDIDLHDTFWSTNARLPFPQVATAVDSELQAYKADMDAMSVRLQPSTTEAPDKALQSALHVMPALAERKRRIDMHMNMSLAILNQIKARSLDAFFALEQGLARASKKALVNMLGRSDQGDPDDRLRLFLAYVLNVPSNLQTVGDMEEALRASTPCSPAIFKWLKKHKSTLQMLLAPGSPGSLSSPTTTTSPTLSSLSMLDKVTGSLSGSRRWGVEQLEDSLSGTWLDHMVSGVRNLLPDASQSPLIRCLDQLMSLPLLHPQSGSTSYEASSLHTPALFFTQRDPARRKPATLPGQQYIAASRRVLVFMLGGLTFDEYQLIQSYFEKSHKNIQLCIGATDLINSKDLLKQLEALGGSAT